MRKGLKRIGIVVGVIIVLLVSIIVISYGNHKIQLSKEDSLFIPNGQMIQVDGNALHVYTQGQGKETLVFMSGGGTCSPVLDFKSLYGMLKDEYTIAVVEKVGYGFSEDANVKRDIDTILDQTRKALSKAGLQAPYILFAHSMSGIEALYWAQQYPSEVKAIIGLDMAVPEAYQDYQVNQPMLKLSAFGSKIGITRFFPGIVNSSSAIKDGNLTEEEKDIYRAVFYRRTLTKAMFKEVNEIKVNAEKVKNDGIPNIPHLFFISNGEETGWDAEGWIKYQTSYIESATGPNQYIKLKSGHYIHNIESETIAEESKKFIKQNKKMRYKIYKD